jgi:phage-related protein
LLDGIIQALPVLIGAGVQVLNALVNAIVENLPLIIDAGLQILNSLVNAIIELLPLIITAGVQILVALINGIVKALPQLIAMLPTIINTIITVISENLPLIIEAGIKILVALIEGLIQALPQLISYIPQIINAIVVTLVSNLPQILQAGVDLIEALMNGLIQAIPMLLQGVSQVWQSIKDSFADVDWGSIGENIINGIGQGLENAKNALLDKASNIASNITSTIKNALDIHSPSRIMRDEVGTNIVKGISVGMELESPNLQAVADEQIGTLTAKLQSTVGYETARTTASIAASANKEAGVSNTTKTITNDNGLTLQIENFNNNSEMDIDDIGSELAFSYKKRIK